MIGAMIVDDEDIFRENLKRTIDWESLGIGEPVEANNGRQALERAGGLSPLIVLCDVKMPGMDGLTLLSTMSDRTDMRFILISGYDDFSYVQKAIRYGAFDYVLKPVKREELTGVLLRAVNALSEKISRPLPGASKSEAVWERLSRYESLMIHYIEQRDISGVEECIRAYLSDPPEPVSPEKYGEAFRALYALAEKSCRLFRLPTSILRHDASSLPQLSPLSCSLPIFGRIILELTPSNNSEGKKIVENVICQMQRNLQAKWTLELISKRYFINPSYFSQLFKNVTGRNFSAYLTDRRMEKAKALLQQNEAYERKLYEIAQLCGYDDEKYFSRIFKKTTGYLPSDYQRTKNDVQNAHSLRGKKNSKWTDAEGAVQMRPGIN